MTALDRTPQRSRIEVYHQYEEIIRATIDTLAGYMKGEVAFRKALGTLLLLSKTNKFAEECLRQATPPPSSIGESQHGRFNLLEVD
jgi:hypothetical protein